MTDESLTDTTAKPEADVDLTEATAPEPIKPADFDLMAWLSGLGPEVARYPLAGGGFIPLRARGAEWRQEWIESTKDATVAEKELAFGLAHIADDRVTEEDMRKMQQYLPKDFDLMLSLALAIDDKPLSQIGPRFLPAASD